MRKLSLLLFFVVFIAGCGGNSKTAHLQGVVMLIDTSGTYTREIDKAQRVINVTLSKLYPGDSFAVARIDKDSFSEKDIIAKMTFDERPSKANQEKRLFKKQIDKFVKTVKPASHTDITGGILQAIEYLNEKKTGKKTILVFSDMQEELPEGYNRDFVLDLTGYEVVALNVTKLRSDNFDPQKYMGRLEDWQKRVESGGGKWRVTNDMSQLEKIFLN